MPFNKLKRYPDLLELSHLGEKERKISLRGIFDRDIAENDDFSYGGCRIYPIKTDGKVDMDRVFAHLTTEEIEEKDECGELVAHRVYEPYRSERLHWIKTHVVQEINDSDIIVFSVKERNQRKRMNIVRTYVYNRTRKYVIVFEPQTRANKRAYYLLTAYYLNKTYGKKQIEKKLKTKLPEIL